MEDDDLLYVIRCPYCGHTPGCYCACPSKKTHNAIQPNNTGKNGLLHLYFDDMGRTR